MTAKNGNEQQRRNARFAQKPLSGTGTCPLKGPNIAIVPMRYALDRSHHDANPAQFTPLSTETRWEYFPELKTRSYTLRQLRDGYVYVYDETDQALHEYRFNADDASLTRIVWSSAGAIRTVEGQSRTHLLYPRTHKLRLAFSPWQWTWSMCQQLSTSGVRRALWMRELNLSDYCRQMSARHALPLTRLSRKVVADVDPYPANCDGRFADSAHPPAVAADVLWTGSVEDKSSALMIALDDPLAMLEDLSMQLAGNQAAQHAFQIEHEHALNIAGIVERLCGVDVDNTTLPATVRDDDVKTRRYVRDVEAYFEQLQDEDDATVGQDSLTYGLAERPSTALGEILKTRYGKLPDSALRENWQTRSKWRREIDLDAARDYSEIQQTELNTLRQQVVHTQHDIKVIGEYIGTEPLRLFVDTTHPESLLCLLEVISDLLCNLSQDLGFSRWLQKEEARSKTLLGLARFGFSGAIKQAMTEEANRVMQGISDFTALAGRAGELNGFLTHDTLAEKPWMKALSEPAQLTLSALQALAKDVGKTVLENIQMAFMPVDSRLSKGLLADNAALMLRNLVMGHVLLNHPEKLQINSDFATQHSAWKAELIKRRDLYQTAQYRWLYQAQLYDRRAMASLMQDMQRGLKLHMLKEPLPFDYHSQRYAQAMQTHIANFFARHGQLTSQWSNHAKAWSAKNGLDAGAITWGIAAVNLLNSMITYEIASRDGELSKKDWAKVLSATAYTGNALMAVFVETGWRAIKDLHVVGLNKNIGILKRSADFWDNGPAATASWGNAIRGFGAKLVGMGAFAVVAASLEWWDIEDDYQSSDVLLDKSVMDIKKYSVAGFLISGGAQAIAGIAAMAGYGKLVALVMNPWFLGVTVLIGMVYLFATLTLNYLKRDAIGHWLHKCRWSLYPDEHFQTESEENQTFIEIQLSPALFIKPTFEITHHYSRSVGYLPQEIQNGAWLQLRFPEAIRGETVHINLTGTGRPFPGFPVEKTGNDVKDEFISYGNTESVTQWRNTPLIKKQAPFNDSPHETLPPAGEDVIWQTWVPLDEKAHYLELQIWYSAETLEIREGDKGYRYQIELALEGSSDNSDNRVVGSNKNSLQVESLGGRQEATLLPIPL